MSKDDARKLLGGYATGSLTEAERRVLFEAALEDQDLFDELAGEQVLKEVLEEPGARQRLIAALEPSRRHRGWLWAGAAATAALAVVIGIVVSQRTPPPPQQIAQVTKSPEPANAPAAPPLAEPPTVRQKIAPAPPAPPPVLKKEDNAALAEQTDPLQQAKPQVAAGAIRQFAAARAVNVFALNYTIGADGFLELTPAASGFLSVTASDAVVFPSTAVSAGTAVRIAIPSGATSLVIAYSKTQDVSGTPVRRDAVSGIVGDQDPPNGKILIQLFLTPATQ